MYAYFVLYCIQAVAMLLQCMLSADLAVRILACYPKFLDFMRSAWNLFDLFVITTTWLLVVLTSIFHHGVYFVGKTLLFSYCWAICFCPPQTFDWICFLCARDCRAAPCAARDAYRAHANLGRRAQRHPAGHLVVHAVAVLHHHAATALLLP